MKRTLNLIMTLALTLTTWSLRAGINPRVVEVDLSIEDVADPAAEFTPGGGGFVAKDGWKKITLSVSGAGSARLNWNSTKIGVYMAPGGEALSATQEKIWPDTAAMPPELWVKGVDVSDSGPTATTCGPEHICLEALNNGTPYATPYFDRVGFTVVDMKIKTKKKGGSTWDTETTRIAAGGMATDIHYADLQIDISPTISLSALLTLCVELVDGGAGYCPEPDQQWWWPASVHKRALLEMSGLAFEYGITSTPIQFNSGSVGSLIGTIRSGNRIESSTIRVGFQGCIVECTIAFAKGDFEFTFPESPTPYGWNDMSCVRMLDGVALEGHQIAFLGKKVVQADDTVVETVLGDTQANSRWLESYLWIDEHASDQYDAGQGLYVIKTIDSFGAGKSKVSMRGFHKRIEIGVVDLNVAAP